MEKSGFDIVDLIGDKKALIEYLFTAIISADRDTQDYGLDKVKVLAFRQVQMVPAHTRRRVILGVFRAART